MVLVAATAVGMVIPRPFRLDGLFIPLEWNWGDIFEYATRLNRYFVSPIAVAWTFAVFLLRLRRPRPRLRLVFRQPGMAASTAALVVTLMTALNYAVAVCLVDLSSHVVAGTGTRYAAIPWLLVMRLPFLGDGIAVAWLLIWLSQTARPERSWIDRTGRVLGIYWLFTSTLHWIDTVS